MTEQSTYPSPISKFLSASQPMRRAQSLRVAKERSEFQPRPSLDLVERGLGRSRSKKATRVLVNINALASEDAQATTLSWGSNAQPAQHLEGNPGIKATPAELAALAIILGCPPTELKVSKGVAKNGNSFSSGKGAFGISISGSMTEDGTYHISLKQHRRNTSRLPARGSGYSTQFAKHMACGSLPYSRDKTNINSIFITTETLEAVKMGTSLQIRPLDLQSPASYCLLSLPASRRSSFYTLMPSSDSTLASTKTLTDAIASLPFNSGLVPLAAAPIIQTVHFVASGGLPAGRLLQRLDALVEKVHRQAPSLHLFGPLFDDTNAGLLFRERERLGRLSVGATAEDSVSDKAARVHRYITLIERLMALVPGMNPHDVLASVQEATKREMKRSYEAAVTAYQQAGLERENSTTSSRRRRSKRSSSSAFSFVLQPALGPLMPAVLDEAPLPVLQQQNSPQETPSLTSSRNSTTFPTYNLGRQVEQILKLTLPLDVDTIARVVRLVVVAWTVSVAAVDAEDLIVLF